MVPLKQLKVIADADTVNVIEAVNKAHSGVFTAEEALKAVRAATAALGQAPAGPVGRGQAVAWR